MTIHHTTEGIEFESSDMESKEPDYKAMWQELERRPFHYCAASFNDIQKICDLMSELRVKHTPKPETLESVVREYVTLVPGCGAFGANAERATVLFYKMREMVRESK